jgi:hypothetical protein
MTWPWQMVSVPIIEGRNSLIRRKGAATHWTTTLIFKHGIDPLRRWMNYKYETSGFRRRLVQGLCSSGLLRSGGWWCTEVFDKSIRPIFKGQAIALPLKTGPRDKNKSHGVKSRLRGGHFLGPRRLIHWRVKWLSSHARAGREHRTSWCFILHKVRSL